jgi:Bcr/CflA subfamily drug resistance transporter
MSTSKAAAIDIIFSPRFTLLIALLITLLAMLGIFIADVYVPALPYMAKALNASQAQLELSVALYFLSFSLSQLVYGPFADRFGRKPIILLGLLIALMGSLLCLFATNGTMLITGRLIQGVGMGAPLLMSRVILRDLFRDVQLARWNSYMGALLLITPALAPIVGGYLVYIWHWSIIFMVLLGLIAIMLALIWHILPETCPASSEKIPIHLMAVLQHYYALIRNRTFLGYTCVAAMAMSGMITYVTISSFLFQHRLGFSVVGYSWLSLFVSSALIAGMLVNARLLDYIRPDALITAGLFLKCLAGVSLMLVLLWGHVTATAVLFSVVVFSFGCSIVFANATSGAMSPFTQHIGLVAAVFGATQMFAGGFIASLAALLQDQAEWVLAILFFLLGLSGLSVFKIVITKKYSGFKE